MRWYSLPYRIAMRLPLCIYIICFSLTISLSTAVKEIVAAEDTWTPVTDVSLIVTEGSALDFSSFSSSDPAGKQGPLRISPQGYFEFSGQPGKRQRFWSASIAFSPPNGGFPTRQLADLYARQLRIHGYNMIRLHQVDAMLMVGRKTDFDFNPEQWDRFQYFLAALKSQGIYWIIDLMTSENGAYGGEITNRWENKHSMKSGVYFDPERQGHWKQLATRLLASKNPYTGLTTAGDPALAGIILVNENGLTFQAYLRRSTYPEGLAPLFTDWLRKRYVTEARLRERWGRELQGDESLSVGIRMPRTVSERSERMGDFLRFVTDIEASTVEWMTKHVRDLGYAGPVTSLNNVSHLHTDYSRRGLGWIDMHSYHVEPSNYVSPGSEVPQSSSFERRLFYFRELAASRHAGKPFTVTEYGQPFWNSWRREAGLAIAAYARLQDWDMISQFGENTIELSMASNPLQRKNAILPFGLGLDPVARATETLAGLLFQRGDVSPARRRLVINIDDQQVFQFGGGWDSMPGDFSTMALLTGLAVSYGNAPFPPNSGDRGAIRVDLDQGGLGRQLLRLEKWIDGDPSGRVSSRVEFLRQAGVLSADNSTNAGAGVFQSDTSELLLDATRRALSVITPKTEALSFDVLPAPRNGKMRVISATGAALVALSALDDRTLQTSQRVLGILATDAINTGMTFSDAERKKLASLGTLPPRLRTGSVVVELETNEGANLKLYALRLNGERAAALPVERTATGIRFRMDVVQAHGPTTFFELASGEFPGPPAK